MGKKRRQMFRSKYAGHPRSRLKKNEEAVVEAPVVEIKKIDTSTKKTAPPVVTKKENTTTKKPTVKNTKTSNLKTKAVKNK
tara:strand:- start:312 stop:554 length:243 start_codon:yes stop_codon:yes gene_type:complete